MAGEMSFKLGEPVPIVYQAPNAESGLANITAEIVLPNGTKDSNFPDVVLTEVLNTGSYKGSFTPDQQGEWIVIIHKADGNGKVIKRYSVGAHNVHTVGEGVAGVNTAVGTVDGKVTTVDGKVENVASAISTVDGKANSIISVVNEINTKVGGLDTPAMAS